MLITRTCPRGRTYFLSQQGSNKCAIILRQKRILVPASLGDMSEGWFRWQMEGKPVQEAFPFLNAGEREFLITGMTSDEWDAMFKGGPKEGE